MEQIEIVRAAGASKDTTILRIHGPLTLQTLFDFQNAIRQPDIGNTIVDLTNVPYIDSAGLGAILSHWAHTQRTGSKFAVVGICDRVQVLFNLTKVGTVLPCFATPDEAEQSFSTGSGAASAAEKSAKTRSA
jgi:anti-sigma B factor antagonist